MTTKVRITHASGNKKLDVKLEGSSVCEALAPNESVEVLVHSGNQLTIEEVGGFIPAAANPDEAEDEEDDLNAD